jgi:hypothetical protein
MSVRAISTILCGLAVSTATAAASVKTVTVDCSRGDTIVKALDQGAQLVVVRGTCNESVSISRDDVTLRGEGGAINGPDAQVDTLTVMANRVTIQELAVGGGRNGITGIGAATFVVRNTTVQSTGRTGILYTNGSSGLLDGCTVRFNPRDGVVVETASAAIINSNISQNLRGGIFVGTGGAARIGVDPRNQAAGNAISQNGATGITVVDGGQALIGMNEISGNGTDPNTTSGRFGIFVGGGNVDLAGGNVISGHPHQGILARSSTLVIGNTALGISGVNTISNNGSQGNVGGIFAILGSSLLLRDAVISNNFGSGLILTLRSQAQMSNTTVENNSFNGVFLQLGSALLPSTPASTVSGNGGFGVECIDSESSVINAFPPGVVSPNCTAF